jgi:2,3-bisphosphoglycerate-independent phosphoglycerate mutase
MDDVVKYNTCGLMTIVLPGITPGSGPGHLSLFGYNPLKFNIGRGVLEAMGIDFKLGADDIAARGNFCSVDQSGVITDRRAGRISSETGARLVQKLKEIRIKDVEVFVEHVREYRFVVVMRGKELEADIMETDPYITGVPPHEPIALSEMSKRSSDFFSQFCRHAKEILRTDYPANMITLRGYSRRPTIKSFEDNYGMKAAAIAIYPMYRGLGRLVGMEITDAGTNLDDQIATMRKYWDRADFFFVHFKYTDSTGEDGKFKEKVLQISELDTKIPLILDLSPDVFIVTGDHSTPSKLMGHSWHPVPVLLASSLCRPDNVTEFSELSCINGGLGQFEAKYLMPLALAHADRLNKFGA